MTINHPLTDVGSHRADQSGARRVTNPPNMERQVHKACGDINAALNEALEALGRLSHSPVDAFGVARVQTALYRAREANYLLGQMVGTPIERRLPWAYYRARLQDKALRHFSLHANSGRQATEGHRSRSNRPKRRIA
ncbi:hypothetical protein BMW24_008435 [Mycobacterium heckeshornense]|uniref:Uncharacterized protein n=1 Tax=Mycobacterium heckeshornense TaxID=110505 RepID=A0A2G8BDF1_9MYCO|nr:hypothetical protein [Mycobacterium heckeshornense]KMV21517.1 hypothetical protein ACT16_16370 [Mycobacterium heckeshornense]MCV7035849.1 hypothetical protein [Mycobacterium heckeshornense]PIJ35789.1 hypothetical protein BMW24_008435 [Mycobacterium heckeshornense]BCO35962.1 hypothetical protein MHEC_23950 [Mycobacterium heckeshornense]BCQ09113.1 hypothetical protein JMUB5695_02552 [Mycobacterium heckeshornense]